jgi:hypothetical protein
MKSRVCDSPYLRLLDPGLDEQSDRLRCDGMEVLVHDDHEDSQEVRADDCHGVLANGCRSVIVLHPLKFGQRVQSLCVFRRTDLMKSQFTKHSVHRTVKQ